MKYSFVTLLLFTFSFHNFLKPMEELEKWKEKTKQYLKICNNPLFNIYILEELIKESVKINSKNIGLLPSILPIFFNKETINNPINLPIINNEQLEEQLPIGVLISDSTLVNEAVYKLFLDMKQVCTPKQIQSINIKEAKNFQLMLWGSYRLNKKEYVRIINPLDSSIELKPTQYLRIKGKNFLCQNETGTLSARDFFLHINNLDPHSNHQENFLLTSKDKVKYWKAAFKPAFHPEAVSDEGIALYYKQLVTLYGCFRELKNTKKIIIPKSVINHHIAPHIRPEIFTERCNTIYNDIQGQITLSKNTASTLLKTMFQEMSKEEQEFFENKFEPWFTKKTKDLVGGESTFDNVKKVVKHYNNNLK